MALLSLDGVEVFYGKVQVLYGVSLEVNPGEIFTLLGRNGAGKSTLLKSCVGLLKTRNGSIKLDGHVVSNHDPNTICSQGVGFVFQERSLFPELTVKEHLRLALTNSFDGKSIERAVTETVELFPDLEKRLNARGGTLSGGEAQMLEISMALIRNPKLLLLDEPSQGLSSVNIRRFMNKLKSIKGPMTFFLSEQNIQIALELSDAFAIIRDGTIVYRGVTKNEERASEIAKKFILG